MGRLDAPSDRIIGVRIMTDWAFSPIVLLITGGCIGAGGLCLGLWLSRIFVLSGVEPERVDHVSEMMHRLYEWTHGMAKEMAEYQDVVDGLTEEMGNDEQGQAIETPPVVGKLVDANRRLRDRLASAEETLREQSEELAAVVTQAHTDSLTGLPNRRSFDAELERRLAEFRRKGTPLSILLIDVDHFKAFNDRHGHLIGDRVLGLVAQTLEESTRDSDLATRFGGEEFAVILPDTPGDVANLAAERIRLAIEGKEMLIDRQLLKVTVSGGIANAQNGDVPASLIERADVALYRAKEAGRNRSFYHDGFLAHPTVPDDDSHSQLDENFSEICNALRQRLLEVSTPRKLKP